MAPLWKTMLSKSSPLYRDALFSFSLWEWKAQEREVLLLKKAGERERKAMLTQIHKLSKELQQKDKIIESLQSRLNQHHHPHGSNTPCSSHALSDATDQLDRISYVSEDGGSTAEDLELCSDVEAASKLHQKETDLHPHPSAPPTTTSSQQSWISCPSVQFSSSPRKPSDVQSHAGFPKPLQAFQPPCLHGFQPMPFLKAGAGLLDSTALWDIPYGGRAPALGADVSSGSSGYQSGTSHTGSDLMKEHLREIRSLRQRLEDSISTNDGLRQQLEERLACSATEKGGPTNIYIQGLDSVAQLSTELRYLKEEKESLQKQVEQLEQSSREGSKEAELLKEAVLLEQAKVKEAELEVEKLAAQSRKQQSEAEANGAEIAQLKHERQQHQEAINRLQHEVSVLQQQLCESRRVVDSLQVQGGVCATNRHTARTFSREQLDLTFDPSELQPQPEQQLNGRSQSRREQLVVRDSGLISPPPTNPAAAASPLLPPVKHSGAIKDKTASGWSSHHGRHTLGHMDDFHALTQQLYEGRLLLQEIEAGLFSLSASQEIHLQQPSGFVAKLLSDTKMLQQILEEAQTLLQMFWRAALLGMEPDRKDRPLQDELASLRLRLSEQDQALKDAMERVKSSTRTKDNLENLIVSQLSRTRDVLRQAKTNLQTKTLEDFVSSTSVLIGAS